MRHSVDPWEVQSLLITRDISKENKKITNQDYHFKLVNQSFGTAWVDSKDNCFGLHMWNTEINLTIMWFLRIQTTYCIGRGYNGDNQPISMKIKQDYSQI